MAESAFTRRTFAARLVIDPAFTVGEVDPRLFGSFVEHMGRCVYTGIYEPGHPDRGRGRLPRRRPRADPRTRRHHRSLPRRQLRVRLHGRTASARARSAHAGSTSPGARPRPTTSALDEFIAGRGKLGASRCWPSTSAPAASTRPANTRVLQPPGGHRAIRPARASTATRAVRHQTVVPWQRDGRPLADRPEDRRRVRPARRRGRQGDAAGRPVDRARRLRQLELARCRPSAPGRRRSSNTPTTSSTTSPCTPTTSRRRRRPRRLPGLAARPGPLHRRRSSRPPTPWRAAQAQPQAASGSRSTSGTSGTRAVQAATPTLTGPFRHAPRCEDDYTVADARRRRLPADHPAAPRRPRADRLPGPARQRHRADRTLDGGPAWRQTSFYPFMHAVALRPRQRAAGRAGLADLRGRRRGAVPRSRRRRSSTRRAARSPLFAVNRAGEPTALEVVLRELDGVSSPSTSSSPTTTSTPPTPPSSPTASPHRRDRRDGRGGRPARRAAAALLERAAADGRRARVRRRPLLLALALALALAAWPAAPARAAATDPIAHDPTLIKQGAYYYDVITGDSATRTYLPLRRSRDLVHWEFLGTVFTTPPAWVVDGARHDAGGLLGARHPLLQRALPPLLRGLAVRDQQLGHRARDGEDARPGQP